MREPNAANSLLPDAREALSCLLDLVIPRSDDGRFPGAGELGLAEHVDLLVQRTPSLRPLILQGLAALEQGARRRGEEGFPQLAREARQALVDELAASLPHFLPTLAFLVYTGYYGEPRVQEALGLEPRPPFPKGHEMPAPDLSLLERVRRRGKLYREC